MAFVPGAVPGWCFALRSNVTSCRVSARSHGVNPCPGQEGGSGIPAFVAPGLLVRSGD